MTNLITTEEMNKDEGRETRNKDNSSLVTPHLLLNQKAASVFAGKVVRKDLVRKIKVGANVPVYVLEYLLGKYCATDDAMAIEMGLTVVKSILTDNFVRPDESNKAQSYVREKGKHTLIDKIKVRYLSDDDKYWAELPSVPQ